MSWKSKKQCASRSSVELEYHVMTTFTWDLVSVKDLLSELDFTLESPIRSYCVNQDVIHITENFV